MDSTKKYQYEFDHSFPGYDRQKFWEVFVDNEAWSESEIMPGEIIIDIPGEGHPQGVGAVRTMVAGSTRIQEDIVGFRPPEYFHYETRDGSLPVNDFGGEFFLEERNDKLFVKYRDGFNAKYPFTGRLIRFLMRMRQRSVLLNLGEAYQARYGA